MNLAFVRERYAYYSGKASDIVSQLDFAGIALVWLFKTEIKGAMGDSHGVVSRGGAHCSHALARFLTVCLLGL